MDKQRENKNPNIQTHYTPESLAKYCLNLVDYNENDFLLDVGAGHNMVWYNNFNTKNRDWVEIEKGKDFFNYTKKVDWCLGNPPYKNLYDYMLKSFDISRKGVGFLVAIDGINRLTPKRLDEIKEKGFYLTKISIVSCSKWFGRYFFIQFEKDKSKNILTWERTTFKDDVTNN